MLASGDWLVPRLNGLLYFEKPPLGYWLNSLSLMVFGETSFGVRFASALFTGISALMVFAIGRTFFVSPSVPFLAVFVFLTTLEVQAIGTFSVLDPVFSTLVNGGILIMVMSVYRDGRRRAWLLASAGVWFGLAFLAKGFLAFALPVLVILPWLLVRKECEFILRHAWFAVMCALLTILPWALSIHAEEEDFWRYFFWVEHIQRFASENAQHKEPLYYFLLYLPALAFPWIFFLPTALSKLRTNVRQATDGAILVLILWAIIPFVFFSIASGKLSTYILPCFVPFSVLVAAGLNLGAESAKFFRAAVLFSISAVVLLCIALGVFIGRGDEVTFGPDEWLKQVFLFGSLLFAIGALLYALISRNHAGRILSIGVSVVPFLLALPLSMPESVLLRKAPVTFIRSTYMQVPEHSSSRTDRWFVR